MELKSAMCLVKMLFKSATFRVYVKDELGTSLELLFTIYPRGLAGTICQGQSRHFLGPIVYSQCWRVSGYHKSETI
jgi:hypothetical protein